MREDVFFRQGVREGDHSKVANDSEDTAHDPERFEVTLTIYVDQHGFNDCKQWRGNM